MLTRIKRLVISPVLLGYWIKRQTSSLSRLGMYIQARYHGGRVNIAPSAKFLHPVIFQGRGVLTVDERVSFGYYLAGSINAPIILQPRRVGAEIRIGPDTAIMNGCEIIASAFIQIGAKTLVGPQTLIVDSDFHGIAPTERHSSAKPVPVIIDENVWIGGRVIILKGVHIGKNAVIGAGSVIAKDVPPDAVVAGNPMRLIGRVDNMKAFPSD